MTSTPALIIKLREALDALETQCDAMVRDIALDSPELGEVSSDFALETLLDSLEPEDFEEFGLFARPLIELLAAMAAN